MTAPPGAASPPLRSFADILSASSTPSALRPPERFKGMPAVSFSDDDVNLFAHKFRFALVGKFEKSQPPMADIRKTFDLIGFGGAFTLRLLDQRHILMNFDHEADFQRCWLRKTWSIKGALMRVFKWTPDFHPDMESPIVPVWIAFEGLPAHLQDKRVIYSIANLIGSPLKVDSSTLLHNRPSVARVCVELDVSTTLTNQVWINNGSFGGFAQKVTYEFIPPYCLGCRKFGHLKSECSAQSEKQQHDTRREPMADRVPERLIIVPPRKRWRQAASHVTTPEDAPNEQPPQACLSSHQPESENSTAPFIVPDANAPLGATLIDDQGVRRAPSDSQPGHLSDGDELLNVEVYSPSLLDSWKEASKMFALKLGGNKQDNYVTDRLLQMITELGFSDGFASETSKIWLLWSADIEVEVVLDSEQFVCCTINYLPWQFVFSFLAVYGKHTRTERAQLWAQLSIVLGGSLPVLLSGDFNVISSLSEYRGSSVPDTNSISDFSSFICDNNLIDLSVIGNQYTGHGIHTTGPVWKRLDRFLMNAAFRDVFTDVRIVVLARTTSDHAPILLTGSNDAVSCPK
ncbi:PREDICTED: uncharacterized protein LOC109170966 [Ipomoea nil]|uniref:uncharacterized protein LOC109170966 n=1 Tax=Ipomoea nil TaxID=35883 RepID=UPI0009011E0C|nr:PREDICTED: uncharacterized protein LOC109170966 [Ipomoea nil]